MAQKVIPQGPGTEALPPAGDEQRDELKRRGDALDEIAETLESSTEVHAANPDAFKVENELAQHFNELEVSNAHPAYVYCWTQSGFYGRMVKMKLAEGWEVVQGDMEEAIDLKGMGGDTTRRLGDVILMRMDRGRHLQLKRREAHKRDMQNQSVTGALSEMADKYRGLGLVVHTDINDLHPSTIKKMADRSQAKQVATSTIDQWTRQGRMPGRPAPRAR